MTKVKFEIENVKNKKADYVYSTMF